MRLGNGRWEHTTFDPERLQVLEIGLGTSATNSSLLKLEYYYGGEQNNGNFLRQIITVPTIGADTGFTATQHYQYDQLNRLTGAQEVNCVSTAWQTSGTPQPFWQQMFSYDRFGNRAVVTANTTSTMVGPNPEINTTNNRITPSSGEYYDFDKRFVSRNSSLNWVKLRKTSHVICVTTSRSSRYLEQSAPKSQERGTATARLLLQQSVS